MNEQKLIFILTWLFLLCIILASSEISVYIFNYGATSPDYIGFMFIANLIAAGLVSVNLFAHYLKRPNLYRWGKYGFGFSVIGCLLVIFYNIYLQQYCQIYGPCQDRYISIPLNTLPIFILSIAGYALTFNQEKNGDFKKIDYHILTLIFNILVSIMMGITLYVFIWAGKIFENVFRTIFSIYGIAAIVILFNVVVFATKKWNLYMPVIVGYGIFAFGNLCFVITLIWECVTSPFHPDDFELFFWAFAWVFLYAICGIFGLILTIFSYNEAKKNVGKIGIIDATAAILPTKVNPKAAW